MNEQLDRIEAKLRELEVKIDATFSAADKNPEVYFVGLHIHGRGHCSAAPGSPRDRSVLPPIGTVASGF